MRASVASYQVERLHAVTREVEGGTSTRTNLLTAQPHSTGTPMAFAIDTTPHRVVRPHFHANDQFQVFFKGDGTVGAHALAPVTVHYTRAMTGYGPLVAGPAGLAWVSMYSNWDKGAYYLPDCRDDLLRMRKQAPWQASGVPEFGAAGSLTTTPVAPLHGKNGVTCLALRAPPSAPITSAVPAAGGPMFLFSVAGDFAIDGAAYAQFSLVSVRAGEALPECMAGPQGCDLLVLGFPRADGLAPEGRHVQ